MNLFDKLVNEALQNQPELSPLKIVVEKELLHHDILRIMRDNGLLQGLTFIGGTCLRTCYGSIRLSEDLDFTGGANFSRQQLSNLAKILIENLHNKYGLDVVVSEPIKDTSNVDTWKIKIETRKKNKHLPAQRINIDICSVQSYEPVPMMLLNPYGVDMGTSGMIVQVESLEEIYSDKIIACALRPNRIKHRDLWDIFWLTGKAIQPRFSLIALKLQERNISQQDFLIKLHERVNLLQTDTTLAQEFYQEMYRFLPQQKVQEILNNNDVWQFIVHHIQNLEQQTIEILKL